MTSSDDEDLLRRAKGGCAESAAVLAARHQCAVVHYASRLLARRGGNAADAEDVAQEALVRALTKIGRHDDRWAFSTWLFAITRRRCLNHLRDTGRRLAREAARSLPVASAPGDDPAVIASAHEESQRLWAVAARELSEKQFSALWLRTAEDLSVAEIGRVLQTPEATVKVLLFRARRRLAEVLQAEAGRTVHGERRLQHG